MSGYKYTSWGRTRRPKAATTDGSSVTLKSISELTALDIANNASNISADNGIYKTENQYILIKDHKNIRSMYSTA